MAPLDVSSKLGMRVGPLALISASLGLLLWGILVAIPGRSDPFNEGHAFFASVPVAALGVGALARSPKAAALAGGVIVVPGIVLARWTAPPGDGGGDGRWFIFVAVLVAFAAVTSTAAVMGQVILDSVRRHRSSE